MTSLRKIIEQEKGFHSEDVPYLKNYEKCLIKEGEFSINILKQKKEEEKRHKELQKSIEKTKSEIQITATEIAELKTEIDELKAQHYQIEKTIKDSNAQAVKPDDNESITDALRKTHRFIKHKLKLYEEYLGCTIAFHEPDIYVFSFSFEDNLKATVKFQLDNGDSEWTILDYEPEDLLTSEQIKQFEVTQDTQKLLGNLMIK